MPEQLFVERWEVIVGVCAGLATIIGTSAYFVTAAKKITKSVEDVQEGVKCMLRSAMLATYYKHHDEDTITQYEFENFEFQYKAYKALKGNSFIDKVHEDVVKWEITNG